MDSDGCMVKNTTIEGYSLGSDGAWIQIAQNSYKELDKIQMKYSIDTAKEDGDVISSSIDEYYNIEKLDKFIENYKNKKSNVGDMVRIISYTIDGGVIISDLIVNDNSIKLTVDNTRDQYASEKDRKKIEYKVIDINKTNNEKNNFISYYVKTDQGEELCIL
ncbi:DUF4362 domain-containing protein [Clostridium sp. DL-VIII]|uniref:DUF4362 domain-containing protein n=1 Tax=Clostridium sp. DL-VIII TaxID=641107 RepID=UPI001FA72F05|nr:DUF4362 domain-containing protein [Clostridium sp. DL-VIII]